MRPALAPEPLPYDQDAAEFAEWVERIAQHCRNRLGLDIDDLPELPLRHHFDLGASAPEFYVHIVMDVADALGLEGVD